MAMLRHNTMAALKEDVSRKTKGWREAMSTVESSKAKKIMAAKHG